MWDSDSLPAPKAAEALAVRIEGEILAEGWPVGKVIGSEADLADHYTVSRAVMREAIRILEHHFVVRSRRGRGGGLVVTEPDSSTVARSMKLFLQFQRASGTEIHEARTIAELAAVEFAAARIDDEGRTALAAAVAAEEDPAAVDPDGLMHEFHILIGQLSRNHVLDLNVRSMATLVREWGGRDQHGRQTWHADHAAIADAVSVGDGETAVALMRTHMEGLRSFVPESSAPKVVSSRTPL